MKNYFTYLKFPTLLLIALLISCSDTNTIQFSKTDYSGQWPFSVDKVEVYCAGYKEIYCKTEQGRIYPLNGSAKSAAENNPEIGKIEEIWLDNPDFEGTKIPYIGFIEEGLKLCENK